MPRHNVGIETFHQKHCATHRGGNRCSCSPSYRAQVWDRAIGKARKSRRFKTKAEATSWLTDTRHAMKRGQLAQAKVPKVDELAAQVFALAESGPLTNRSGRRFKPSAIRNYRIHFDRYLLPEFGGFRVSDLSRKQIQQFSDGLAAGRSPSTVRNILMPLRLILRYATEMEFIVTNPMEHLRLPAKQERPTQAIAPSEGAVILSTLSRSQDRAIYALALYAGLRLGEIRAIRWKHIDFEKDLVRVEASWDRNDGQIEPKSRAGHRVVPLVGPLRRVLEELEPGPTDAFLFPSATGGPFCPQTLYKRVDRELSVVELHGVRLHACRHSYASFSIEAGVNMKQLSTFMGHASISITIDRYGHLLPGSEADAGALLTRFLIPA